MANKPKAEDKATDAGLGAPGYFFGLIGRSLTQLKRNSYPALLYIALYAAASAASQVYQKGISVTSEEYKAYEAVVNLVFIGTLPLYGIYLARKKHMSIADFIYIQPKQFFYALLTSILVALIIIFSAFALFIPLIWTLPWFALSVYVMVDRQLNPIEAMKACKQLCEKHKRYVWGATGTLLIVCIPLIFIAYAPYVGGISIGFATVLSSAMYANLYRDLEEATA